MASGHRDDGELKPNTANHPNRQVGPHLRALTIHDVINDLTGRASKLAPAVAYQTLDTAGTTDPRYLAEYGPRQREAHRLVASAFDLNAATADSNPEEDERHARHMRSGGYGGDANRYWASEKGRGRG